MTQYQKHRNYFFLLILFPGIVGLVGFILLGGTLDKFFYGCAAGWFLNMLFNHTAHKWLTHNQFEPKWYIEPLMLWSLTTIGDIKIGTWVIYHKVHHWKSDTDADPAYAKRGVLNLLYLYTPDTSIVERMDKSKHIKKKIVQFIDTYTMPLYFLNLVILAFFDIQLAFLSLFALRLYSRVYAGVSNYIIHNGARSSPINLKWYWEFLFFGECLHKDHHENVNKLDLSSPGRLEPSAKIWKFFAKKKIIV